MEIPTEPDLTPFRRWLQQIGSSPSTGYRLVNAGKIKLVHIGRRSYITREERAAFIKSLEQIAADQVAA